MITEIKCIQGFIRLGTDGFKKGWHERNGGNLTYRLTEYEVQDVQPYLNRNTSWFDIDIEVPNLANEYFITTGSGKFFRNLEIYPEDSLGIIQVDETGTKYKIVWGLVSGGNPTSELPTHLLNHSVKKRVSHNTHRVIYHAHTTNLIALTFVLPLDEKVFTRELWEMATECPVVFPEGVGIVPWMVPGGRAIGTATSKLMESYNIAIWAHHGTFCSGVDFDTTFGLMDTIEKSAEILVKVISMTPKKLQTITKNNFDDLAKAFKVELNQNVFFSNNDNNS